MCSAKFETFGELDEHIKQQHNKPRANKETFHCEQCKEIFNAKYLLRQHVTTKHVDKRQAPRFTCNKCEMQWWIHSGQTNVCRHFIRGDCWKGQSCMFYHPEQNRFKNVTNVAHCNNGIGCKYLASGVCRFFHQGVGVKNMMNQSQQRQEQQHFQQQHYPQQQQQKYHQQHRQYKESTWCRFLEDCDRVPNCPFTHYEEDFPKLSETNNPPEARNRQRQTYQ